VSKGFLMASVTPSSATSLRVAAAWGTTVVCTKQLHPGQSCILGDGADALIAMPDDLFASNTPIRAVGTGWQVDPLGATGGVMRLRGMEQDPTRVTAGELIRLRPGDWGLVQYGTFSIFFQLGFRAPSLPQVRRSDRLVTLAMLVSLLIHAALFAAIFVLTSRPPIQKPAELQSREEMAARFGVRPEFIRPTPGPWSSGDVAGAPGAGRHGGSLAEMSASDVRSELEQAIGMVKSLGPAGSGRRAQDFAKSSASGAAPGRRVVAAAGAGIAQGGVPKEKVKEVVTAHVASIKACYEIEAQRIAGLRGEISIAWQIAPDGTVTSATVSRTSLGIASAETCMLRQVKQWQFPVSAAATNVTWSFGFALGD